MVLTESNLRAVSFPVGGIGAGCIGLAGNGDLSEWEVFNRPAKGARNGMSHFAVRAEREGGGVVDARILHGDFAGELAGAGDTLFAGFGFGPDGDSLCGLPHFRSVSLRGEFPVGEWSFRDALHRRTTRPPGIRARRSPWFRPCVDGTMGEVLKTFREWRVSGDAAWLRSVWPSAKKALAYAWSPANPDRWDPEKSGVLAGRQHHTLDMELFGPSAWLEGLYLAALRAAWTPRSARSCAATSSARCARRRTRGASSRRTTRRAPSWSRGRRAGAGPSSRSPTTASA